ncbi:hypothetical protein EVAR_19878_1 [Eumeta japonica]|uniref:Uncharacterized protein n=1 Tax=Eumeta variegata TaxID=151549 RepID=A0A4C1XKJ3_EUMVA|nr:hypothetical protein EVAR_19878_1 [Eumeta japonica]
MKNEGARRRRERPLPTLAVATRREGHGSAGCRCGTEDLLLPHARASSRRGYDPDGSIGMVRTIVSGIMPVPSPHRLRARAVRGHARSSRMRSQQMEGGHRLGGWYSTRMGGRRSPSRTCSRPLVDADRIKAARIGDPLGVDLTERACRPLIRLSMHPTAAARAVRVSEPRPSSSSFFSLRPSSISNLHSSIRCLRRATAGARVIAHALSGGRAARRTLQRPVSAGGGRTNALCTSVVVAVPSRLHFNKLKCGDISFGAVVYIRDLNKLRVVTKICRPVRGAARSSAPGARVRQHTRAQDGLRWPLWASGASSTACAGGVCDGIRTRTRGRLDDSGELASDPAAPRRGVRRGPLPGVNCVKPPIKKSILDRMPYRRDSYHIFRHRFRAVP